MSPRVITPSSSRQANVSASRLSNIRPRYYLLATVALIVGYGLWLAGLQYVIGALVLGAIAALLYWSGLAHLNQPRLEEDIRKLPLDTLIDLILPQLDDVRAAYLSPFVDGIPTKEHSQYHHDRAEALFKGVVALYNKWDAHIEGLHLAHPTQSDACAFLETHKDDPDWVQTQEDYHLLTDHLDASKEATPTP